MVAPRDRKQFKKDFGYEGCFKCWGNGHTHICHRQVGHDAECVCGCGERTAMHQSNKKREPAPIGERCDYCDQKGDFRKHANGVMFACEDCFKKRIAPAFRDSDKS